MGLLDRMFGKKTNKQIVERKSIFDCDYPLDKSNWFQVFSACLGKMMVIQNACGEIVVKDQNWNVDLSKGIIAFGRSEYPAQFIGSESTSDNSWLWGWENINGFDKKIIAVANATKRLGESWQLEPLTTAEFDLTETFNGHNLSIVTCGISKENICYYRGPHPGGAIFVSFSGVPSEVFTPIGISTFTTLTMQCIQRYYLDQRIFIESLLLWNGTIYGWKQNVLIAHFEQDLYIEYEQADEFWRIRSMETK